VVDDAAVGPGLRQKLHGESADTPGRRGGEPLQGEQLPRVRELHLRFNN
jgi:hypothetical protein